MLAYESYALSSSVQFDVMRISDPKNAQLTWNPVESFPSSMTHIKSVADGRVFHCMYYHSVQQPNLSMWWLRFYENVYYWVATDMSTFALGEF